MKRNTLIGGLRGLKCRMVTRLLLHTWWLDDFSVRPYCHWRNMTNWFPHWPGWWCSWPSCNFHSVNGILAKPAALLGPSCPDFYWWKLRSPPADSCGSGSVAWASAPWKSWKRWMRHYERKIWTVGDVLRCVSICSKSTSGVQPLQFVSNLLNMWAVFISKQPHNQHWNTQAAKHGPISRQMNRCLISSHLPPMWLLSMLHTPVCVCLCVSEWDKAVGCHKLKGERNPFFLYARSQLPKDGGAD